jgi:protein-S-isoprenylcysteine O-methyltransferase Ste14
MTQNFWGFLVIQVVAALALGCFVIVWPGPWNTERYAGVALAMIGIILLFAARFQLGRSFSVTAQARKLVTHGIYSKIRNPIYVFSFLMVVGVLLVVQKSGLFVLPVVLLIVQTIRARKEAQVLEGKFGDKYRLYRRGTWF